MGTYDGSSWVANFLGVQTEPASVVSIPGGGWYIPATDVVLTAPLSLDISSNTRYRFSYWDIDGISQGNGANPITVHMDSNHAATAHYITQYYLTVSTDPTAIAPIPGEGWYDESTHQTLTAQQVQSYQFNYWDVDGSSQGSQVNPITVSMNTAHLAIAHYTPTTPMNTTITIINVTILKNIVGQGFSANINVTVANEGYSPETFNVTLYANSTIIDTLMNLTLTSRNTTTVPFTWNTRGFTKGNYTISVYVSNETGSSGNLLVGGWVTVTIPGDIDGNGWVNVLDAITLANSFGKSIGQAGFNPNADLDGNNVVNILEAIILANHFLQHYP
jgi:hypothetical protein